MNQCVSVAFLLLIAVQAAPAAPKKALAPIPDLTAPPLVLEKNAHDWTLGPTGLRGWMFQDKMDTAEARQVLVTRVDAGSPADGLFATNDVILGVGDAPFADDPRVLLGQGVGAAEAEKGALRLLRWRGGKQEWVTVKLPVLGRYGETAPYACPKSERILSNGSKAIAAKLRATPPDKRGNPIIRSLNALALLASGDPAYLPRVREEAKWAVAWPSGRVRRHVTFSLFDPGDLRDLHGLLAR